jgi:hypothetical protein
VRNIIFKIILLGFAALNLNAGLISFGVKTTFKKCTDNIGKQTKMFSDDELKDYIQNRKLNLNKNANNKFNEVDSKKIDKKQTTKNNYSNASLIKVTSWNLKNLSAKSADRDWTTIKNFIASKSNDDVIMLQELMNESALNNIKSGFQSLISKPKGKSSKNEYYGFLVNKKYKSNEYWLETRYSGLYSKFRVPPSILIINKKFAFVNVHIIYGENSKIGYLQRYKEVIALHKIIQELKKQYSSISVIVGGDFNMEIGNSLNLSQEEIPNINQTIMFTLNKAIQAKYLKDKMNIYITDATSVGKKIDTRFKNSYDHFITSGIPVDVSISKEIIKYRNTAYFHQKVSDHLPISGTFAFSSK